MKNEFDFVATDKICDLLVEEEKSLKTLPLVALIWGGFLHGG